jgi:hypothetical protein
VVLEWRVWRPDIRVVVIWVARVSLHRMLVVIALVMRCGLAPSGVVVFGEDVLLLVGVLSDCGVYPSVGPSVGRSPLDVLPCGLRG